MHGLYRKHQSLYKVVFGDDADEDSSLMVNAKALEEYYRHVDADKASANFRVHDPRACEPRYSGLYPIIRESLKQATTAQQIEECVNEAMGGYDHLNEENYAEFFHTVLFLEELEILKYVKSYSHKHCPLKSRDKLFVYEVQNELANTQFLHLGGSAKVRFEDNDYRGRIVKLDDQSAYMSFNRHFKETYDNSPLEIEFQFNRLGFVRQHSAVDAVCEALGIQLILPMDVDVEDKEAQVDVFLADDGRMMQGDVELKWFNEELNTFQRQAVVNIMQGRARPTPHVIFGPPGTGKTSTLIETILQIFKNVDGSNILIATPSNNGANLICELLLRHHAFAEDELVRLHSFNTLVKSKSSVSPDIINHSALVDTSHPGQSREKDDEDIIEHEHDVKRKLLLKEVLSFRVVVTTCSLMGCFQMRSDAEAKYSHVFIDEAGQCCEPEALIPISLVDEKKGQIVLAGDPKQLGPVVFSSSASNQNLGRSLLGRILDLPVYKEDFKNLQNTKTYDSRLVTGLFKNYRALPSILNVYSGMFYDDRLIPTVDDVTSKEAVLLRELVESKLIPGDCLSKCGSCFHNVRGKNVRIPNSHSWCNFEEVDEVYSFTAKLYRMHISPKDIGIISPYKLQVKMIEAKFKNANIVQPKIGSVEEFQGQERNIILVSTVRSCPASVQRDIRHLLGFVRNPPRLNVAISRARALNMIFGNAEVLQRDEYWREVIKGCYINKTICGAPLPDAFCEQMEASD